MKKKNKTYMVIGVIFVLTALLSFYIGRKYQAFQDGVNASRKLNAECFEQLAR